MTPDAGARPGELSPADGSGPRELLRYRSAHGRWVVAAMILGSSVAGIDSTVVAVALPAIGRNLHAGFQGLQWTVTSYTLTLASLILLAGSLSDRWGRRRVFLAGLGWFTLASVLCAAAPSIGWLIAARAVQGIGGALMTPASLAIIEAAFQPGDRTRAIGTWAGFSGVSSAIAPFLGGWLLEAGSWRWIFLINVPVAAAVAWTTQRHVPESRDTSLSRSADWPSALAGVADVRLWPCANQQPASGCCVSDRECSCSPAGTPARRDCGWTPDRYEQWVRETLITQLLTIRCADNPDHGQG